MKLLRIGLLTVSIVAFNYIALAQKSTKQKMIGTWSTEIIENIEEGQKLKMTLIMQLYGNSREKTIVTLNYISGNKVSSTVLTIIFRDTWDIKESYRKKIFVEESIDCTVTKNLIEEFMPDPCSDIEFMLGDDSESETEILAVTEDQMILKTVINGEEDEIFTFKKVH